MLIVLMLLLAGAGLAQTGQDARPLLREVAGASRGLATFRASGLITQNLEFGMMGGKRNLTFRVATRSPGKMRIEFGGVQEMPFGEQTNITSVCEGPAGWTYADNAPTYSKITPGEFPPSNLCSPGTLTSFEHVADEVISATITGTSRATFEGRSTACTVVQARYRLIPDLMAPPFLLLRLGHVSRTMCIDPVRKLIMTDHLEADMDAGKLADHIDQTVTYERIERNPDLPATLFEFEPPKGKTLFVPPALPKFPAAPPEAPFEPRPNLHTMPQPLNRVEPEYSQEAWDEGIQGTVIVLADVEADGAVAGVKVQQSIGYGLDEKAIECVRKWQFRPAMVDLERVKGVAYITLDFTLPDKRPAQPSASPVPRPVPPARLPITELKTPTELDHFFHLVAVNLKAPALCAKIDPMADGGGGGWSTRGRQIQTIQSKCYSALAAVLKDPKLCEYVKPVRTDAFDGSSLDKADCVSRLRGGMRGVEVPDMYGLDNFVGLMRKTGADDRQVAECLYQREPYNNETSAAYRKLLVDKQFLDRVHAARSYAEAWAPARPARILEHLYTMVAVDTDDAGLCEKISPNATFTQGKSPTRLLRSECYVSIAYNRPDTTLCEQLPRSGASPYVVAKFDSREFCQEYAAIRKASPSGPNYGFAPLPHAADFPAVLVQIGYPAPEAAAMVPKPTPDDYWSCFPVQDRATFLKRVMSLR